MPDLGPCVVTGKPGKDGYVRVNSRLAHKVAWEDVFGPVPKGYDLHHRCENKACRRITHLEALRTVTHRRRHPKIHTTHCPQGHPYDWVGVDAKGYRQTAC